MPIRNEKGQFNPGTSGNPGGRPKDQLCLTTLLRNALAAIDNTGKPIAEKLIDALINLALEGNVKAIEQIYDRLHGPSRSTKVEVLDIATLIDQVGKRAENRRATRDSS